MITEQIDTCIIYIFELNNVQYKHLFQLLHLQLGLSELIGYISGTMFLQIMNSYYLFLITHTESQIIVVFLLAFIVSFFPENMLVVQGRFILMDSPLVFFIALSICCYIKFLREHNR